MKRGHSVEASLSATNPFIAFVDVLINLLFIFLFFSAALLFMGRLGKDDIRYKLAKESVKKEVERKLEKKIAWNDTGRNDPVGSQRWVFSGTKLFKNPPNEADLRQEGRIEILAFAKILKDHQTEWRRLRIEGHTKPTKDQHIGDWDLSERRAATVAELLSGEGGIAPYFLSVSGRAGQNPIYRGSENYMNDRFEILIEYSQKAPKDDSVSH